MKESAMNVLRRLIQHGYQAYFVGGCVRDWLLGKPVHDIDICTDATPEEVMSLFPVCIPTGLKHGTVTVQENGLYFEVTTFRTESGYVDFRRPSEVRFVKDVREDLARRDFTINAMAMKMDGSVLDPFGGKHDLNARLIRAVGNPVERFCEDALRMLRAARFSAQMDFAVEKSTYAALQDEADALKHIARERIRDELQKLLDARAAYRGLALIREAKLLRAFPLLQDIISASQPGWERMEGLPAGMVRWAYLLSCADADENAAHELCHLLRFSKRDASTLKRLLHLALQYKDRTPGERDLDWKPLLLQEGLDLCLWAAHLLSVLWQQSPYDVMARRVEEVYKTMPVHSVGQLAIGGKELQERFSLPPGPWIRNTLHRLLEQVAYGKLPNQREELLKAAEMEVDRNGYQTGHS